VSFQSAKDVVRITADDGRHRGRGNGAGLCHRTAALAYEHHRLFCRQDPDPRGCSDLTDRVTGNDTHQGVSVGRMGKQFERGEQAGGDQKWLGDRGISYGFGVRFGAVVPQVKS
jgi:hypothetical protein